MRSRQKTSTTSFRAEREFGLLDGLWAAGVSSAIRDHQDAISDESENQVPGKLPLFAPSALREYVADWFEMDIDSPCMLLVADVAEKRPRKMTAEEEKLWGIEKLSGGFGYVSLADKRANFSNVDFAGQENLPGLHHKHNITLPGVGGWQLFN